MRNLMTLATCMLLMLFNASCNKDKDESNTPENRIAAKWIFEKVAYTDYMEGVANNYIELAEQGDYIDFRENGTLLIRMFSDEDEGTWRMEGADKVYLSETDVNDAYTFDIKTLNANSLVLYAKETEGANYFESTIYLKK